MPKIKYILNRLLTISQNIILGQNLGEFLTGYRAYKKEVLETTGLFDESFGMYNEDHDLGWRIWLADWRCVLAPQAIVYHKYEFTGDARKYYRLDRNRILAMIKNYQVSTLFLISFAFVFMEFGVLLFAIQKGRFRDKFIVYQYLLSLKNWEYLLAARRKSQALRRVKVRVIIGMFSGQIWYDEIGDWKLNLVNHILDAYWNVIKWILRLKPGAVH
jgi:GT2 family glycosyltransferase